MQTNIFKCDYVSFDDLEISLSSEFRWSKSKYSLFAYPYIIVCTSHLQTSFIKKIKQFILGMCTMYLHKYLFNKILCSLYTMELYSYYSENKTSSSCATRNLTLHIKVNYLLIHQTHAILLVFVFIKSFQHIIISFFLAIYGS